MTDEIKNTNEMEEMENIAEGNEINQEQKPKKSISWKPAAIAMGALALGTIPALSVWGSMKGSPLDGAALVCKWAEELENKKNNELKQQQEKYEEQEKHNVLAYIKATTEIKKEYDKKLLEVLKMSLKWQEKANELTNKLEQKDQPGPEDPDKKILMDQLNQAAQSKREAQAEAEKLKTEFINHMRANSKIREVLYNQNKKLKQQVDEYRTYSEPDTNLLTQINKLTKQLEEIGDDPIITINALNKEISELKEQINKQQTKKQPTPQILKIYIGGQWIQMPGHDINTPEGFQKSFTLLRRFIKMEKNPQDACLRVFSVITNKETKQIKNNECKNINNEKHR